MDYEHFMKKALEQAEKALAAGEFPVGCVIVHGRNMLVTGARKGTAGDFLIGEDNLSDTAGALLDVFWRTGHQRYRKSCLRL